VVNKRSGLTITFPFIPGNDLSGEIVAVGSDVTTFQEGDWSMESRRMGQPMQNRPEPFQLPFRGSINTFVACGRLSVTTEQYSSVLAEHGVPEEVVSQLVYLFTEVLDGRNAHLTDGVRRALGREPRDFARDTAASGVWAG
jgi:hypothetical protein